MRRHPLLITAVVVALVAGALGINMTPASATPLGYTVDTGNGHLWSIDLGTGANTDVGATNTTTLEGLTLSCNGTLFGIDSEVNDLVTIDTTTGAATTIGPLGVSSTEGGLTFGTDGTLWLSAGGNLYQVNTSTGAATLVGSEGGQVELQGLATSPTGTIYGVELFNHQLYTVDTATGAATLVGGTQNPDIVGIDFDSAGTLWGLTSVDGPNGIVTIDLTTGNATGSTFLADASGHGLAIATICAAPVTTTTTSTSTTSTTAPATTTTTRPAVAATPVAAAPAFTG